MRIGIDARPIDSDERLGIGTYTYSLIKALAKIDKQNEYSLFYSSLRRRQQDFFVPDNSNFKILRTRVPIIKNKALFMNLLLWSIKNKTINSKLDIFHSVIYKPFKLTKTMLVSTIHDLAPFIVKGLYSQGKRSEIEKIVKISDRIIVVSDNTKNDLLTIFNIKEDKIFVTPLGINGDFNPAADCNILSTVKRKYNLPDNFILYVGNLGPHKNVKRLIEAFCFLKRSWDKYKLVCVGRKGSSLEEILRTINNLGLERDVLITGYVKDEDLPTIYKLAKAFVFPSLYEGFGLPVLEAMASGIPVATSGIASLPEVAGDAALFFNPIDPQDIALKIDNILRDKELRDILIERGLQRAKRFTWENTARGTLEVYKSLS